MTTPQMSGRRGSSGRRLGGDDAVASLVLGLEALELSAVTHADPRCLWACVAYTDLANLIGSGAAVAAAVTGQSRPQALAGIITGCCAG